MSCINSFILDKIRKSKDGEAIITQLISLYERDCKSAYHRGTLHGFLLALTVQGIVDSNDALDILDAYRGDIR